MKKIIFLCIGLLFCAIGFSQITDSTAVVTYDFGDSFMEFVTKNVWTLVFAAFYIISEWLGSTGKIKEGSVYAIILNWIGKFLRTKGELVKSKKVLRILILGLIMAGAGTMANAQVSIFKPVPKNLFRTQAYKLTSTKTQSAWLWRLSAAVTAVELSYNKDTKQFDSQPLSSAGPAIGYRHYTQLSDGTAYNDFGINLALLLGTDITQVIPATIKAALLVNAFQFVNVGVAYNFSEKRPGILMGTSINF